MPRIFILEDDRQWAALTQRLLKAAGHEVLHCATPGRLFDALLKGVPDLLMLDMQLPGMHGREVLRVLRANEATRSLLVIAVSAHDRASSDAVKAFENGADDYFPKPFDAALMLARIDALLKRGRGQPAAEAAPERLGALTLWPDQRLAKLGDKPLELTNLEFELLRYFLRQPNRVLTRSLILKTVWRTVPDLSTRTVDKHVESLRRKLGPLGSKLETVVGAGYLLNP
ncbi:MAG: response regulator transcription factor [Elusimicrobia bacterium]|nr:response regulator transcription factor [Elusimicrobiota bacterium]MDE2237120.1 response regulator transcription factor [Elusimicrobiota bacterium]MDE2426884.1 response regulator transcription factor [Elusimicrobiota bacterium]